MRTFGKTQQSIVEMPYISAWGWTDSGDIDWINVPFPEDVSDLLINDLESVDDIYGNDEGSDLEDI